MTAHESSTGIHVTKMGSERSFGIVFAVVFALVSGFQLYRGQPYIAGGAMAIASAFALLAVFAPGSLRVPNMIWFRFGQLLHRIISPAVLGGLFFLTVTPVAAIYRLMGKDPLSLRLDKAAKSYWIHRDPSGPAPETMSNQF